MDTRFPPLRPQHDLYAPRPATGPLTALCLALFGALTRLKTLSGS